DGWSAFGGFRRSRKPVACAKRHTDLVPASRCAVTPGRGPHNRVRRTYIAAMNSPDLSIPVRQPAATSLDDTILPFAVKALDLRGRIVRLGAVVDTILTGHDYPIPVAKLLGEAIVLTVMLGSALKIDGRFILQTQSDGPVRMLVVDFTTPGTVRACARFDAARVAAAMASNSDAAGVLLGR